MDRNESWSALQVAAITIRAAWGQLQVTGADVQELQLFVSGSENDTEALKAQLQDGVLTIEQPVFGLSGMNMMESHWLSILLRVPYSWKGAMELTTTSGRLSCKQLNGSDLKLETVNGPLQAHELSFITADLNTVSGAVRCSRIDADQLDLRTVSGDVSMDSCCADTLKLNSVTGDLRIGLSAPFISFSANSVTAGLTLTVPLSEVHVQRRAVAGHMQLWQAVQASGAPTITMNTVSGDLQITGNAAEE